jgi:uncharacterized protein YktA (UPF0223 family)
VPDFDDMVKVARSEIKPEEAVAARSNNWPETDIRATLTQSEIAKVTAYYNSFSAKTYNAKGIKAADIDHDNFKKAYKAYKEIEAEKEAKKKKALREALDVASLRSNYNPATSFYVRGTQLVEKVWDEVSAELARRGMLQLAPIHTYSDVITAQTKAFEADKITYNPDTTQVEMLRKFVSKLTKRKIATTIVSYKCHYAKRLVDPAVKDMAPNTVSESNTAARSKYTTVVQAHIEIDLGRTYKTPHYVTRRVPHNPLHIPEKWQQHQGRYEMYRSDLVDSDDNPGVQLLDYVFEDTSKPILMDAAIDKQLHEDPQPGLSQVLFGIANSPDLKAKMNQLTFDDFVKIFAHGWDAKKDEIMAARKT